jgi:hypothetical protein
MEQPMELERWLRKNNMETNELARLSGCTRQVIWKAKRNETKTKTTKTKTTKITKTKMYQKRKHQKTLATTITMMKMTIWMMKMTINGNKYI